VHQKEKPHDAISKNADLGDDHYRVDCVRNQQLGACIGHPLGRSSFRYEIASFNDRRIPAWIFAFIPFAPDTDVAAKAAHIDA